MGEQSGRSYQPLITVSEPEGDISLSLREDRLKLRMSIVRSAKPEPPSLRSILTLLKERKIQHGIQQAAIQEALTSLKVPFSRISDVLIAKGDAPRDGEDAHLRSLLDAGDSQVKQDQAIAERCAPTEGKTGKDVYGQGISPQKGEAKSLTAGPGTQQQGEHIIASVDGHACISRDHAGVSEAFAVTIDDHGFVARLSCSEAFAPNELLDYLDALGIVHGLLNDEIAAIAQRGQAHNRVIAQGQPPKPGQDAKVEVHFVRPDDPRLRDDPDANPLAMFDADTTLITLSPAQAGEPGRDLFAVEHPVNQVAEITITEGDGVKRVEENGQVLFKAVERGAPFLTKNSANAWHLSVSDILKIDGDLTPEYGRLRFEGEVQIKGNIPNEYQLQVDKDLHVGGVISDADIRVGGNLHLASGFIGGHGEITGELRCKYIDNARLHVRGDVFVANELIGTRLRCDGRIEAPKAVLRGGFVSALRGMQLAEIGSDGRELRTDVHAGVDEGLKRMREETEQQLKAMEEEEQQLNQRVKRLLPDPKNIAQLSDSQRKEAKHWLHRLSAIGEARESLEKALEQARERTKAKALGLIEVQRAIHAGTRLCISTACSDISQDILGPVRLVDKDGEIVIDAVEP